MSCWARCILNHEQVLLYGVTDYRAQLCHPSPERVIVMSCPLGGTLDDFVSVVAQFLDADLSDAKRVA